VTLRVLVCDDQAIVRTGFVAILDAQPDLSVVAEAADGREAVRLARALAPDVAVMDIRMPVLDGIDATRELAGPGVQHPVKVLVVTTFHLDEYVYAALQAGASGFLLKDALPEELVAAVRTVAAGEALLAPTVTRQLIGRFAERVRPAPGRPPELDRLTEREFEVLVLMGRGSSNAEIAQELHVGLETVKTHVSRILTKLGLRDRVQAVVLAHRAGLPGVG
jgi:DNA-binding NarL/FixJ family response regulator